MCTRCKLVHVSPAVGMCADVSGKSHHVNAAAQVEKHLCGKFNRLNFEASYDLYEIGRRRNKIRMVQI